MSPCFRLQSAALESAANAIVITDPHGTIQWVNPAFTQPTGYPLGAKAAAIGLPAGRIVVRPPYIVEKGPATEKILDVAKRRHTDLIVLGARPAKGLAPHLNIGTVHKVVSQATIIREISTKLSLLGDGQNARNDGNEWSAEFTRAAASRNGPNPLGCWQLLVSFLGCEFRPQYLERDPASFLVH